MTIVDLNVEFGTDPKYMCPYVWQKYPYNGDLEEIMYIHIEDPLNKQVLDLIEGQCIICTNSFNEKYKLFIH